MKTFLFKNISQNGGPVKYYSALTALSVSTIAADGMVCRLLLCFSASLSVWLLRNELVPLFHIYFMSAPL